MNPPANIIANKLKVTLTLAHVKKVSAKVLLSILGATICATT